ncbi:MAG TPA: ribosome biogenesis GTP-binding protein YihA/YsxC [Myxococcales bacterium]|nr:ribosome biogenesis GTP-binding protein YihA/YsxC [Myxococcales bacterium]
MIVLSADFVKSATDARGWPPAGPDEFAFCGRSNVGKSAALNALAARKSLARVSRTPGRTRLINFFDIRAAEKTRSGGRGAEHHLVFADLPGYGFASGKRAETVKWREMIEEYLRGREVLRALIVLVDGELGAQPSDVEMVRWGESLDHRIVVAATKLDKLSRNRRDQQIDRIAGQLAVPKVVGISAHELFGIDELWREMLADPAP